MGVRYPRNGIVDRMAVERSCQERTQNGGRGMKDPTDRQREVLDIIREFQRTHGFPPTRAEIAERLKVRNISTVDWFLTALERRKILEIRPNTPRGIRLLDEDLPVVRMGKIGPTTSVRDTRRTVAWIPIGIGSQFDPSPTYFAQVNDDAINRIGLHEGDRVALRELREPGDTDRVDGHIVLARVGGGGGGEVLLRRYRQLEDGQVMLSPESTNKRHQPITIRAPQSPDAGLRIEAVMVGAIIGAHAA